MIGASNGAQMLYSSNAAKRYGTDMYKPASQLSLLSRNVDQTDGAQTVKTWEATFPLCPADVLRAAEWKDPEENK